jgi:hypothetical protein
MVIRQGNDRGSAPGLIDTLATALAAAHWPSDALKRQSRWRRQVEKVRNAFV